MWALLAYPVLSAWKAWGKCCWPPARLSFPCLYNSSSVGFWARQNRNESLHTRLSSWCLGVDVYWPSSSSEVQKEKEELLSKWGQKVRLEALQVAAEAGWSEGSGIFSSFAECCKQPVYQQQPWLLALRLELWRENLIPRCWPQGCVVCLAACSVQPSHQNCWLWQQALKGCVIQWAFTHYHLW